jgi:tRNA 2-thiouridine synthesizing protein A
MEPDHTLDTYGLMCPLPIIKTAARIKEIAVGEILEVLSDDEQILEDMPAWCKSNGHNLLEVIEEDEEFKLYVKKMY